MKKIFLLMIMLILISCGDNKTMVTYDAPVEKVIAEDFALSGRFGDEVITCQYKVDGDHIFGKFIFSDREVVFRGEGSHGAFTVTSEDEILLIYIEDEILLGVRLSDLSKIYVGPSKLLAVSEETLSMMGTYESYDNTYYSGKRLVIEPLFNQLLLIKNVSYDDGVELFEYQLGVKSEDNYYLPLSDGYLLVNEQYEVEIKEDGKTYKYSEVIQLSPPDLISLKIAKNESEAKLIETLLGPYLTSVINLAYDVKVSDNEIHISDFVRIRIEDHVYIWISKNLSERDEHLVITNDLDGPPNDLRGQVDVIPILENGFTTALTGSKKDFMPENYHLVDQAENDSYEAIVIENDNKILMVLIKEDPYQLDLLLDITDLPIDDVRFDDEMLILLLSGKDSYYWSEKYFFNTLLDYRLITSVYERYDPIRQTTEIFTYNFISDDVLVEINGQSITKNKKVHETIYLKTFNSVYNREYE